MIPFVCFVKVFFIKSHNTVSSSYFTVDIAFFSTRLLDANYCYAKLDCCSVFDTRLLASLIVIWRVSSTTVGLSQYLQLHKVVL